MEPIGSLKTLNIDRMIVLKKHIVLVFIIMLSISLAVSQTSENISIVNDGFKLDGTLLTPNTNKHNYVVLIIAGSGPTDRDGNNASMKNNSLKYLAEALAENNIASLRYDKRGIGKSADTSIKEENIVLNDFVSDAKAWVAYLKQINYNQVIILGHSEGALIGAKACLENRDVAKFISLAGMGVKPAELLKTQLGRQGELIKTIAFPIIDSLEAGKKVDSVPQLLQAAFRPSVQNYLISLFKNDPVEIYRDLSMPILIVQGTTDLQVSVDDAQLLAKSNDLAEIKIIDSMNHVLKEVELNFFKNYATYNKPELPPHPELMPAIISFIKN